ncbi:MAG: hypothetical protein U1E39_10330 [Planctomycetota bacterium]
MAVAWIPEAEYFSTTSAGIPVPMRAAAIAAKLAADEDLVGRRLLLARLVDAVRGGFLAPLLAAKEDVSAAFHALVEAVDALHPVTPDFSDFPAVAATARALRTAAAAPGRVYGQTQRMQIAVDLCELAGADTEAAAAEAAYRFALHWCGDDRGNRTLRGFLREHPLA